MKKLISSAAVAALSCFAHGQAGAEHFFTDWELRLLGQLCSSGPIPFPFVAGDDYTMSPQPGGGHDWAAGHPYTTCTYDAVVAASAPTSILIRNRNAPYPFNTTAAYSGAPNTLDEVMCYLDSIGSGFDYVLMDLEADEGASYTDDVLPNVDEVIRNVTFGDTTYTCTASGIGGSLSGDPGVYFGNYKLYPAEMDYSQVQSDYVDRTNIPDPSSTDPTRTVDLHDYYLTSGLNVAMPNCYPYETYDTHTSPNHWSGQQSPNKRSALFWAPLERFSTAKRALPVGHKLIPWVGPYVQAQNDNYDAPPPPVEDLTALIQHIRLRGADGFYGFSIDADGHPDVDRAGYRALAIDAWNALDAQLDTATSFVVLNTDTDKEGGVEWSGVATNERIVILASDLNDTLPGRSIRFSSCTLDANPWLPGCIQMKPGVRHEFFVFDALPNPALGPCDGDANLDGVRDINDSLMISSSFGSAVSPGTNGDVNCDGMVDINDLLTYLNYYGVSCPGCFVNP
ncbi:MAG: hypothetical protein F6K17_08610 [Okeania sp. SIO3C4]|nr:hypothetical protein [Okeania sp. SIO3C4]